MPYAADGVISKAPIEGGIEISRHQYQDAMGAMLEGREVVVIDATLVIRDKAPAPDAKWEDGEWVIPPVPEPDPEPEIPVQSPVEKLTAFLQANPDVVDLIGT